MIPKRLGIKLGMFVLLVAMTNSLHAQTTPEGWETYSIPGVCSFAIPSTMEVRLEDSFQGRFVKSMYQSSFFEMLCEECDLFLDEAKLVLQPKGLNGDPFSEDFRKANDSYGRIIFQFSYGDYFTQEELADFYPSDLTVIDSAWREDYKAKFECVGEMLSNFTGSFKWYPVRMENYSGLRTWVMEYNGPGLNVETRVREYRFLYEGKALIVTTSYNLKQEAKYKDDFKTFMQLLKIETNEGRPTLGSRGLFKSDEYHISFSYDPKKFSEVKKQNNASHCFYKLESNNGTTILLSAWDFEESTEGVSIYDEEVVEEMKQRDKTTLNNIVKSCEKTRIGNTEALMSRCINNVYGTKYVYTTYRVFYKDRFYTVDFHVPETIFNQDKNTVNELIKGLQFN